MFGRRDSLDDHQPLVRVGPDLGIFPDKLGANWWTSGRQDLGIFPDPWRIYYIPPGLIASGYVLSLGAGSHPGCLASEEIPFEPLLG